MRISTLGLEVSECKGKEVSDGSVDGWRTYGRSTYQWAGLEV